MNGWVELLRFLLAVIIVVFHCSFIVANRELANGNFLFKGGSCAVEFFFVLSGFLFATSIDRMPRLSINVGQEALDFILRKAKRIWPYSLLSALIILCWNGVFGGTSCSFLVNLWTGLPELFFLQQSGLSFHAINGHMWYISAMLIAIFALYPLARKYSSLFNSFLAPLIALVLIGVLYQTNNGLGRPAKWNGFMMNGLARGLAEICIGCFCYSIVQRLKGQEFAKWIGPFVATISVCLFMGWLWSPFGGSAFHLLFPVCAFVVVVFSGMVPDIPKPFSEPIVFLGRLSLPVYVNQYWAINVVRNMNPGVVRFGDYLICVLETVLLVLVFSLCEKFLYDRFLCEGCRKDKK